MFIGAESARYLPLVIVLKASRSPDRIQGWNSNNRAGATSVNTAVDWQLRHSVPTPNKTRLFPRAYSIISFNLAAASYHINYYYFFADDSVFKCLLAAFHFSYKVLGLFLFVKVGLRHTFLFQTIWSYRATGSGAFCS